MTLNSRIALAGASLLALSAITTLPATAADRTDRSVRVERSTSWGGSTHRDSDRFAARDWGNRGAGTTYAGRSAWGGRDNGAWHGHDGDHGGWHGRDRDWHGHGGWHGHDRGWRGNDYYSFSFGYPGYAYYGPSYGYPYYGPSYDYDDGYYYGGSSGYNDPRAFCNSDSPYYDRARCLEFKGY